MFEFIAAAATTVSLLPERLDLPGLVLTSSGLGALVGAFVALLGGARGESRGRYAEIGALIAALAAIAAFVVTYALREVG